jgi:hypothetical protein
MQEEFTMLCKQDFTAELCEEFHKLHMLTTPLMRHKAAWHIGLEPIRQPQVMLEAQHGYSTFSAELPHAAPGGLGRGHPDTQGDGDVDDILRVQQ